MPAEVLCDESGRHTSPAPPSAGMMCTEGQESIYSTERTIPIRCPCPHPYVGKVSSFSLYRLQVAARSSCRLALLFFSLLGPVRLHPFTLGFARRSTFRPSPGFDRCQLSGRLSFRLSTLPRRPVRFHAFALRLALGSRSPPAFRNSRDGNLGFPNPASQLGLDRFNLSFYFGLSFLKRFNGEFQNPLVHAVPFRAEWGES